MVDGQSKSEADGQELGEFQNERKNLRNESKKINKCTK